MTKIVICGIQQQAIEIMSYLRSQNIKVTHIVTISYETAVKNKSETTWVSYEDYAKENDTFYKELERNVLLDMHIPLRRVFN